MISFKNCANSIEYCAKYMNTVCGGNADNYSLRFTVKLLLDVFLVYANREKRQVWQSVVIICNSLILFGKE